MWRARGWPEGSACRQDRLDRRLWIWLLRHERASSENGTPGPVNTDQDPSATVARRVPELLEHPGIARRSCVLAKSSGCQDRRPQAPSAIAQPQHAGLPEGYREIERRTRRPQQFDVTDHRVGSQEFRDQQRASDRISDRRLVGTRSSTALSRNSRANSGSHVMGEAGVPVLTSSCHVTVAPSSSATSC
jgi:hypothetical protein